MKKILSILRLDFLPANSDVALLLLRLWLGGSLLLLHGWGKLSAFKQTTRSIPDLFGIGREATAALAVFGEVVCPLLIILGFFTRAGALASAINMGVAFTMVHKAVLKGPGSGELAFIYFAGFLTIFIAGSGKFAIDGGGKGKGAAPKRPKPARD